MSQFINWGNGSSGSATGVSGTVNSYATMTATSGATTVTTSLSVSVGDQVLLHQTRHATLAGTWEIVKVASVGSGNFEASENLVNSYSSGAQAVLIPQYTTGTISGALTDTNWNGSIGGIIALICNGNLTISGSAVADGGFRGGSKGAKGSYGHQGEGKTGTGTNSKSANANGGGGSERWVYGGTDPSGGGGGGNGTAGATGQSSEGGATGGVGGSTAGDAALINTCFGGGGGGGAATDENSGSDGAKGGGFILIISKNFTLTGTLNTNGSTASNVGAPGRASCGGGGAGGSILIKTQVGILGTSKATANAGSGGSQTNSTGGDGGIGGVGRIHCDYFTSVSGTTSPTLSSTKDSTLGGVQNFYPFFYA